MSLLPPSTNHLQLSVEKKSSLTFFHFADRWKRRGFPRSAGLASSEAALYPRPANLLILYCEAITHHNRCPPRSRGRRESKGAGLRPLGPHLR